jgi:hypothetical protein
MNKKLSKPVTVAPLTARAQGDPEARDQKPNPWLSKPVARRLEEGRAMMLDLATDLPFGEVLRGRVPPFRKDLMVQVDPFCQVLQRFSDRLPGPVDLAYVREREALINRLSAFEEASENFLGLIRRTRSVMAAQMEKSMRAAFTVAQGAAAGSEDLDRALLPFAQTLGPESKHSK